MGLEVIGFSSIADSGFDADPFGPSKTIGRRRMFQLRLS
jgi:hypothetical protein